MKTTSYSFETTAHVELWQRLCAHPFESSDGFDFAARLAREQGWSRDDARAAIDEYRKFCFLACTAGQCMTPSEVVDQVWHLHLTYTRDYWTVFCPHVLGSNLHHEPARGNVGETARFRECYADTLASYHRHFGAPPERFWPGTIERFRCAGRFRWIDRERYLLLPRPRLHALRARFAAAVLALLLACAAPPAQAQSANPLYWSGGAFLALYLGLMAACAVAAVLWRRALRENGRQYDGAGLETLQIAYLAGGNARVLDAAVADLMDRGAVTWDAAARKLVATGQNAESLSPPLQRIYRDLCVEGRPAKLVNRLDVRSLETSLEARGLLLDAAAQTRATWLPLLVPAALIVFGILKILVGLSRDKPIGFLIFLTLSTAVMSLVMAVGKNNKRSRAGDRALAKVQQQYAHTARAPRSGELPLAVALAGTAIMATTAYAAYHEARTPASSSGDSSGCSSSGGDGGGGGCGGCGGGD